MTISKTNTIPIKYYCDGVKITEAEYNEIFQLIKNRPTAPEGYDYRLTDTLEWELYELPIEGKIEEAATEEDYLQALERLGVSDD